MDVSPSGNIRPKAHPAWLSFLLVEQCCCGCSLQVGSLLIGVISLVFDSLDFALSAVGLIMAPEENWAEGIGMIFNIISIVVTALLVYAVMKKRPGLIVPYLIFNGLFVILGVVIAPIAIVAIIVLAAMGDPLISWLVIVIAIFVIIYLCLSIYFFAVVFSFYNEMRTLDDMEMLHRHKRLEESRNEPEDAEEA